MWLACLSRGARSARCRRAHSGKRLVVPVVHVAGGHTAAKGSRGELRRAVLFTRTPHTATQYVPRHGTAWHKCIDPCCVRHPPIGFSHKIRNPFRSTDGVEPKKATPRRQVGEKCSGARHWALVLRGVHHATSFTDATERKKRNIINLSLETKDTQEVSLAAKRTRSICPFRRL